MNWIESLLNWYEQNARDLPWRRTDDGYAIWISEIMLQQTRVAAVIPYYERFLRELPDINALANVEDDRLHKLWEGLGYYSRARNLKKAANEIVSRFGGRMPRDYDALLSLSGIGEYTAGAIASLAFGIAVPAVDGNVLRVYARLFGAERDIRDLAFKKEVRAFLLPLVPAVGRLERSRLLRNSVKRSLLPSRAARYCILRSRVHRPSSMRPARRPRQRL